MGGTGLKQSVVSGDAGGSTEPSTGVSTGTTQGNVGFYCTSSSSKHPVLLQTAKVQVIGKNGVVMANMLLDTGSDKLTYLRGWLIRRNLTGSQGKLCLTVVLVQRGLVRLC